MQKLNSDTKLKVNADIHGWIPGDILIFGELTYKEQVLARRRIADGDGSLEIVEQIKTTVKAKEKKDGNNIQSKD